MHRQEAIQRAGGTLRDKRRRARNDRPGERMGWKIAMAGLAKYRRLLQMLDLAQPQ